MTAFRPSSPVIAAEDLGALRTASDILARTEARAIAQDGEVSRAFAAARRDGVADGYRRGVAAAAADLASLSEDYERSLQQTREQLAFLLLHAVEEVIGATPSEERLVWAMQKVMDELTPATRVQVFVSPAELESFGALLKEACQAKGVAVPPLEVDRLLRAGEVVLVGAHGRKHVGIAERVARLSEILGADAPGSQDL